MRVLRMSWFLTIIVLCFTLSKNLSEANHDQTKLPSTVVVGSVYCDTCFQEDFSKTSHFISGALVAVECKGTSSNPSFHQETKTNEHGQFKFHLPFPLTKRVNKINNCSVKLISSGDPHCAAATSTSTLLRLKSRTQKAHVFSAGFFSFRPLQKPTLCNQKPSSSLHKSPNKVEKIPLLPSAAAAFGIPFFPPNPLQPPSVFPPIPFQPPPSIFPPNPLQPSPPSIFPPNPLQPSPPSIFPPNPLQPSPPSIFPPIPFQPPSPSPLINLPPLTPGLFPSPPPPPPVLPIPLPPIPFLPPGFPGIPPASPSSSNKKSP